MDSFDSVVSLNKVDYLSDSFFFRELLAEREEILRHKWIESEKTGHDVGFEKALLDWLLKHKRQWKSERTSRFDKQPR